MYYFASLILYIDKSIDKLIIINIIIFLKYIIIQRTMGIGDWGLGIGGLGVGRIPPSPKPKPQTPHPQ